MDYAKGAELARHVLKTRIGKGIDADTLDEDKLRRLYEANKSRFSHGVLRRVVHILAQVKDKLFTDKQASAVAKEIAKHAGEVKTKEEFIELGESYKEKHKDKIRIENLPHLIERDSKQLVTEFVQAVFAVPGVGQSSRPVKTEYGWHVIYVWEELPPEDRSFEEVRAELSKHVLPYEKQLKAKELVESLRKKGEVFIYEEALLESME